MGRFDDAFRPVFFTDSYLRGRKRRGMGVGNSIASIATASKPAAVTFQIAYFGRLG
jgi:hypothetical protein